MPTDSTCSEVHGFCAHLMLVWSVKQSKNLLTFSQYAFPSWPERPGAGWPHSPASCQTRLLLPTWAEVLSILPNLLVCKNKDGNT